MVGIYKITNKINNKIYVGKSTDIKNVWEKHRNLNEAKKFALEKDMALYGADKFEFSILEECDEDKLSDRESFYVDLYDAIKAGYNSKKNKVSSFSSERISAKEQKCCGNSSNIGIGLKKHVERMRTDPEYRNKMVQKYKNNRPNAIPVDMVDKSTCEIVMTFPKIMDGALWIRENTDYKKADYATINKICKGQGKTAYGYRWRYTRDR
ncbi:MAG: hypothetical protein RUMPE_00370 [Eubacteriales bacterium SKADARSKE-1]|nr:hypothetical protein [Eubacteriales bacterium SKADARSKE-1]